MLPLPSTSHKIFKKLELPNKFPFITGIIQKSLNSEREKGTSITN